MLRKFLRGKMQVKAITYQSGMKNEPNSEVILVSETALKYLLNCN